MYVNIKFLPSTFFKEKENINLTERLAAQVLVPTGVFHSGAGFAPGGGSTVTGPEIHTHCARAMILLEFFVSDPTLFAVN